MSKRELDAAGIHDPRLRASYERCRELNAAHGKTYYLATLLLPAHKRPYVHALYGFARYADEIVDDLDSTLTDPEKASWLEDWGSRFLKGEDDHDEVLPAIHDTIERWQLPKEHFEAFLDSMRMDLEVTEYRTFDDLMTYVYGSAAVIGLQMVPVLEPLPGLHDVAATYARDLGVAFQLANFIRDVGEDLRRGRIYLPMEDLEAHGVTREHLEQGVVDAPVRRLLAYEIARTREIFRSAAPGVRLLDPTSRDCILTATTLYGGILDEVERADYRVLDRKVAVPLTRRLSVAVPGLVRARAARRTPTSTASA
ncbi:phytoene/squalene synthase family protein [Acidothermaceae bacterium B102]|nr:phytoene/squalene synthase family protein [Acidothermaceae bacterium B102]